MYKQIVTEWHGVWYAFYVPIEVDDALEYYEKVDHLPIAKGRTLKEALRKSREVRPTDGDVMFTYLERFAHGLA